MKILWTQKYEESWQNVSVGISQLISGVYN